MNNANEIWKDAVGFEGLYMVSNLGNMITLPKEVYHNLTKQIIIRKEKGLRNNSINTSGYRQVMLRKDGERFPTRVHRLVAMTFIPNPENKCCVNHKNGIKTDNRVENLEWVTYSENCQHAVDTGLKKRGHERPCASLSQERVLELRARYSEGNISQRKLAAAFSISKSSAQLILAKKTYANA